MVEQYSGANAEFWWLKEKIVGVPNFVTPGSPLNTTLAQRVQPGATSIVVVSATNAAAGKKVRVGDDYNPEYAEIDSSYVSGTTIPLSSKTWINQQHEAGEVVKEISTPTEFKKFGAFVTCDNIGDLQKIISNAISAARGTPKSRAGNIETNFGMSFELGIEGVGAWLRYLLGKNYTSDGAAVGGGGSTTVSAPSVEDAATLGFTALTNYAAGEFFKVGSGATQEISKIIASWNGTDNPLPLDANYPLRYAHAAAEAIVEVAAPAVHTIKRGKLLSMTQIVRLVESGQDDVICLIKGAKIASANTTFQPNNETVKLALTISCQSIQVLEKNLFGTPSSVVHAFYAPWECKIKKDGVVSRIIESLNFTLDNTIDGSGGRTVGSRFRTSVKEGRGNVSGGVRYQLRDASNLKQMLIGTASPLVATFAYAEDNNHAVEANFPRSKFSGGLMPGVSSDGPIPDEKNFDAETDDTEGSDIVFKVTTTEMQLE